MGAINTTTNPASFANNIQTYYNPKLLKELEFNLVLAPYGSKESFPAIGTTIRFFRVRSASTAGVAAIVEGTTPTNITEVARGYVDVPLTQRGGLGKVTDLVQAIDLVNTVARTTKTMGADAALDLDTVVRNALVTGLLNSNQAYKSGPSGLRQAYFERFGGVVNTGNSANDFATHAALAPANAKMTRVRHLQALTQLKDARIPKIAGKYVVIASPAAMYDVRQDADWVATASRMADGSVFKDAEISLDGGVFIENDNSFIEQAVYQTYNDAGAPANGLSYSSFYLGADAFGIPSLSNNKAGGSPMGPKLIVNASPDKFDPLNLWTTIAWKCFYGCKAFIASSDNNVIADVPHYIQLRTKSTFA